MVYLGSLLSSDGKIMSEISRRLGMARKDFEVLQSIWKHTTLSQFWKLRIFEACIVTKLLYGLVTAVLNKAERGRLDGFQARCIRKILRVPPAYYSRISNLRVLAMARKKWLSEMLVKQQMILMGKLAFRSDSDVVRCSIFNPTTCELRRLPGPAKRGRPRIRWPVYVLDKCVGIAGSLEQFLNYWHRDNSSFVAWKAFVRKSSF
jgi:hypothetical protein